jgi:hypothetical protein
MNAALRLISGAGALVLISTLQPVQASVITVNCPTAVHLADFATCANAKASSLAPESYQVYVAFNATHFITVKILIGYKIAGPFGGFITVPGYVHTFTSSGVAAATDSDLGLVNASLMSTVAAARSLPGLKLDPDEAPSLIGIELPEILTTAIDGALLTLLGPLYTTETPVGTVVQVTAADGTNAQFVRISLMSTVQWTMVPGSLKNSKGQFINSSGGVIGAAVDNLTSTNILPVFPIFSGTGLVGIDWQFWSSTPGGTVIIGDLCQPNSAC